MLVRSEILVFVGLFGLVHQSVFVTANNLRGLVEEEVVITPPEDYKDFCPTCYDIEGPKHDTSLVDRTWFHKYRVELGKYAIRMGHHHDHWPHTGDDCSGPYTRQEFTTFFGNKFHCVLPDGSVESEPVYECYCDLSTWDCKFNDKEDPCKAEDEPSVTMGSEPDVEPTIALDPAGSEQQPDLEPTIALDPAGSEQQPVVEPTIALDPVPEIIVDPREDQMQALHILMPPPGVEPLQAQDMPWLNP